MIMREMAFPHILSGERKTTDAFVFDKVRKRWMVVFFCAGISGAISGLLGLAVCGLFAFELVQETAFLGDLETGLMIAAFPLFALAAHSLDKADEIKKALREKSARGYDPRRHSR
jgi:hypothetical protein